MSFTDRNDEWKMLVEVFATESIEMLDEVEPQLMELEKSGVHGSIDKDLVNTIFRLFHSLKGGAASLGLEIIRDLTHEGETLLDLFRSKGKSIETHHIDLMCQSCDLTRKIITELQSDFDDTQHEAEAKVLRLEFIQCVMDLMDDQPPPFEVFPGAHGLHQPLTPKAGQEKVPKAALVPDTPKPLPETPKLAASLGEMKLDITQEMVTRFADEAEELFEETENSLVAFEKDSSQEALISQAFRSLHSFKGNAGFFGYAEMEHLSHQTENILGLMRDKRLPPNRFNVTSILSAVDSLKTGLNALRQGKVPELADLEDLLARLQQVRASVGEATAPNPAANLGRILVQTSPISEDILEDALAPQIQPVPEESAASKEAAVQRQTIRVDTEKLDRLMELVGELVISEANVANCPELRNLKTDRFEKAIDQLNKITKDLQNIAMSVRMVPIAALFRKMIRPVRDLARQAGKKIDMQFIGEETEVDKSVIELISDPLMHIIRNAVDHGVEPAGKRLALGKGETGVIVLEARPSGGEVWVIIRDDGQGLNRKKILAKARETGLLTTDGTELRDEEVFKIIFEPGFTTAEKITEVSGRGVGLDVVKRNIEKLKGRVEITSSPGKGAQFTIRIPLTLAIIEGMVVRVGSERFVVSTQTILEFIRPTAGQISDVVHCGEVVNVRGQLIPLFRLATLFNLKNALIDATKANVMVVEHEGKSYGLLVDEILGQQQTVVKSLGATLGVTQGISGAAVMPDGRVGLIVEIGGLIPLALATRQ